MNRNLPYEQTGFRKGWGTTDQIANIHWIMEKAGAGEFQKNMYLILHWLHKSFCGDHNKLWAILKEMGIPDYLFVSWETCMGVKKQQLEPDMEQRTGLILGKEHNNGVYCHPAHLTYMPSSVQFSRSVVSDSLWPHESQHTGPPCPSPTPGVHPNSCPLSQWCHPAISSSVIPFFSCPQSLRASESFPISQLFAWGGQSIAASTSASVLPTNTKDWSSLGWTGWISLQSKGLSRVFSNTTVQKHQFFGFLLHSPTLTSIHDHWKNHSLD